MLTRKPREGDRIRWPHWAPGRVAVVRATPGEDDNLCWIRERIGSDDTVQPFIWRFHDGLNSLAVNLDEGDDGQA